MHPINIKVTHGESGLIVVARTRHNELIKGRIIALPSSAELTSSLYYDGPMIAEFARSPSIEQIDEGMWVYARLHRAADPDPAVNEKLQKLDRGPYGPIVFSYERCDSSERYPFVLIGHIEEVRNCSSDPNGPVEVTMRSLHMVLSDIFKRNRWQDGLRLPRYLRNVCTTTVVSVEGGGSSS
ncbi:hypothetical protein GGS26DRAFT_568956 [Hypomontagnella submonticulosa]|nr:hypothetical protein GGS26DRAFT_568956 [Hypomontagnella submonticulosa]